MGRSGGVSPGLGHDPGRHRPPEHETGIEPGTLLGRLVELRPEDGFDPSSGRAGWKVWRTEDMQPIGGCGIRLTSDNVYSAYASLRWKGARVTGGHGAEVYRLMCRYAVQRLGAVKLLASDTRLESKAALEEAGFKLVSAFPPQHAKRRRGYGIRRFEWTLRA